MQTAQQAGILLGMTPLRASFQTLGALGDRTGVDYTHIGFLAEVDNRIAFGRKCGTDRRRLGLIEATAEGLK